MADGYELEVVQYPCRPHELDALVQAFLGNADLWSDGRMRVQSRTASRQIG